MGQRRLDGGELIESAMARAAPGTACNPAHRSKPHSAGGAHALTISTQSQIHGFAPFNARRRTAPTGVRPAIINPASSHKTCAARTYAVSAKQSNATSVKAKASGDSSALRRMRRIAAPHGVEKRRAFFCKVYCSFTLHFLAQSFAPLDTAQVLSASSRPCLPPLGLHSPSLCLLRGGASVSRTERPTWISTTVFCQHGCQQALLSSIVMAQAREVLLESVFSNHRTLLSIFAYLPPLDRRAFQAADFYLHADIRWFLLRAPPVADARGTGSASDSSTSTRLSASVPAFAP